MNDGQSKITRRRSLSAIEHERITAALIPIHMELPGSAPYRRGVQGVTYDLDRVMSPFTISRQVLCFQPP